MIVLYPSPVEHLNNTFTKTKNKKKKKEEKNKKEKKQKNKKKKEKKERRKTISFLALILNTLLVIFN